MQTPEYALKIDMTTPFAEKYTLNLKYVAGGLSDNSYIDFAEQLCACTTNTFNGVSLVTTAQLQKDYTREGDVA